MHGGRPVALRGSIEQALVATRSLFSLPKPARLVTSGRPLLRASSRGPLRDSALSQTPSRSDFSTIFSGSSWARFQRRSFSLRPTRRPPAPLRRPPSPPPRIRPPPRPRNRLLTKWGDPRDPGAEGEHRGANENPGAVLLRGCQVRPIQRPWTQAWSMPALGALVLEFPSFRDRALRATDRSPAGAQATSKPACPASAPDVAQYLASSRAFR